MKLLSLPHGYRPPILNVIGAHLFGLLLGGYVLALSELDPPLSILLLFLVWNLGAGLVSHSTEATRAAWRTNSGKIGKLLFVIANLTIFPYLALWLIPEDVTLLIFLHATLLAKIIMFLGGQFGKGATGNLRL
ncbi:hypothetical protein [Parasphingorhabdus halotolerans]|uniref:Uncharacterized protein n=1 Tax=Parasphingorhabdus halotolerans TaxID=2725558 RepID=A0A6H2DLS6_9SPHN|nr:hypothetical protein [Parasphingorhabdus halotolerans]QJB69340.1 hypothetical protein HF685_08650 [Parasphingorhabdus halotolerans]